MHEHKRTMFIEETYRKPLVKGLKRKSIVSVYCGGKGGCWSVFMNGRWYSNPEVLAMYGISRTELPEQ